MISIKRERFAEGSPRRESSPQRLGRADPNDIRFSQPVISSNCSLPFEGLTVQEAVELIQSGDMDKSEFPIMKVLAVEKQLWSLDNGTLWVLRKARVTSVIVNLVGTIKDPRKSPFYIENLYPRMSQFEFFPLLRRRDSDGSLLTDDWMLCLDAQRSLHHHLPLRECSPRVQSVLKDSDGYNIASKEMGSRRFASRSKPGPVVTPNCVETCPEVGYKPHRGDLGRGSKYYSKMDRDVADGHNSVNSEGVPASPLGHQLCGRKSSGALLANGPFQSSLENDPSTRRGETRLSYTHADERRGNKFHTEIDRDFEYGHHSVDSGGVPSSPSRHQLSGRESSVPIFPNGSLQSSLENDPSARRGEKRALYTHADERLASPSGYLHPRQEFISPSVLDFQSSNGSGPSLHTAKRQLLYSRTKSLLADKGLGLSAPSTSRRIDWFLSTRRESSPSSPPPPHSRIKHPAVPGPFEESKICRGEDSYNQTDAQVTRDYRGDDAVTTSVHPSKCQLSVQRSFQPPFPTSGMQPSYRSGSTPASHSGPFPGMQSSYDDGSPTVTSSVHLNKSVSGQRSLVASSYGCGLPLGAKSATSFVLQSSCDLESRPVESFLSPSSRPVSLPPFLPAGLKSSCTGGPPVEGNRPLSGEPTEVESPSPLTVPALNVPTSGQKSSPTPSNSPCLQSSCGSGSSSGPTAAPSPDLQSPCRSRHLQTAASERIPHQLPASELSLNPVVAGFSILLPSNVQFSGPPLPSSPLSSQDTSPGAIDESKQPIPTVIKRKRGRPRKVQPSQASASTHSAEECHSTRSTRKRGRPRKVQSSQAPASIHCAEECHSTRLTEDGILRKGIENDDSDEDFRIPQHVKTDLPEGNTSCRRRTRSRSSASKDNRHAETKCMELNTVDCAEAVVEIGEGVHLLERNEQRQSGRSGHVHSETGELLDVIEKKEEQIWNEHFETAVAEDTRHSDSLKKDGMGQNGQTGTASVQNGEARKYQKVEIVGSRLSV